MKKRILAILKKHGLEYENYKFQRSDFGPLCFEFTVIKRGQYRLHYDMNYPFGGGEPLKTAMLEYFEEEILEDFKYRSKMSLA